MAGAIEHDEAAPADLLTTDERREIMALCSEAGRAPKFSERAKLQAELIGMVETIARREFERGAVAAVEALADVSQHRSRAMLDGVSSEGAAEVQPLLVRLGVLDEGADRG